MKRKVPNTPPWGRSHHKRGLPCHEHAIAFATRWPERPFLFSVAAFDTFAEERGVYTVPKHTKRGSPAWRVLVDKRRDFKRGLNLAGAHDRLILAGIEPFFISVVRAGVTWMVRASHEAYKDKRFLEAVEAAFGPVQTNIEYMLQSCDWSALPPYEPRFAELYYGRLVSTKARLHQELGEVMTEFAALEQNLRKSLPPIQTGGTP